MEVMAVGFLTELELDAESARVFWPIYNAHKEELDHATRDLKEVQKDLNGFKGGSDDEFYGLLTALKLQRLGCPVARTIPAGCVCRIRAGFRGPVHRGPKKVQGSGPQANAAAHVGTKWPKAGRTSTTPVMISRLWGERSGRRH